MAGSTHGAWCHIEIPAKSMKAAAKFYEGVFGWKTTFIPEMNYTIYQTGDGEIGGGICTPQANQPHKIVNYINVKDLDVAARKVTENGGKVLTDRMDVGGHGAFRIFTDPDGNEMALWQSTPQPKAKAKPRAKKKK